jgi:hypothetical protein
MTPRGLIFAGVLLTSFAAPCWAANKELAMCVAVGGSVETTNDLVCEFSTKRGSVVTIQGGLFALYADGWQLIQVQNNRACLQRDPP